jgi:hypothetical protein
LNPPFGPNEVTPVKVGDSLISPTTAPVEGLKVRFPEGPATTEVAPLPPEVFMIGLVDVPVIVIPVPAVSEETQPILSTISLSLLIPAHPAVLRFAAPNSLPTTIPAEFIAPIDKVPLKVGLDGIEITGVVVPVATAISLAVPVTEVTVPVPQAETVLIICPAAPDCKQLPGVR